MHQLIKLRGDSLEVKRVMRELNVDELTAQRHVDQFAQLRERLASQHRARLDACVLAWGLDKAEELRVRWDWAVGKVPD